MIDTIQNLVRHTDKLVARAYLSVRRERSALVSFLFHALFVDKKEIEQNLVDPLGQGTTVARLREFIKYYRDSGYRFVSPADILAGLEPGGNYVALTFDDGYFNNALALPLLEEFGIPATFFISTDHVRESKSYWWDVLYRERIAQGATPDQVYREGIALKSLPTHQMEMILRDRFGEEAFVPRGDIDRPFSPRELLEFSRSPFVHLGNHTANHAILTNYQLPEIREQIAGSQQWLEELIGKPVLSIAYPNGAYNAGVIDVCAEVGLKVGFTVEPAKNRLPLAAGRSLLQLSRFSMHEHDTIRSQCRTCQSDVLVYSMFREAYLRLAGRRVAR